MRTIPAMLVLLALAASITACGRDTSYTNEPRPPVQLQVAATISDDGIEVSPETFGAGPITMLVSNQSGGAREVTLQTEDDPGGSDPGVIQSTGELNAEASAAFEADLPEGTYQVSVEGDDIEPAAVEVGPERESASDTLLLP